ncbi:50S ribosomal protein L13 [Salisaeta longa]|uniref:50S ribosomal protein L13 n=1 Tax=Salisaeta longa TaxID=503170 RepID=UPI0003B49E76|nr:50S ribosomal protein L13 [Salisaeta longa]
MDTQSFKTYSAKPDDVERAWYVIDATDEVVGRLASRIAHVLRGKHKPSFTPHIDTGDYVVVVNADKARFTGRKETDKTYRTYSGYPGGERELTPEEVREQKPTYILEHAVKGMMPSGPLARRMLKKLKIYAGADHPHDAQQPQPLDL